MLRATMPPIGLQYALVNAPFTPYSLQGDSMFAGLHLHGKRPC
jgi:hypothetical protein